MATNQKDLYDDILNILGFDAKDLVVDENKQYKKISSEDFTVGLLKYVLKITSEKIGFEIIKTLSPCELVSFESFRKHYNRKLNGKRGLINTDRVLDKAQYLFVDVNKKQKLDDEVNYKKLYEELLRMYKELENKCKVLMQRYEEIHNFGPKWGIGVTVPYDPNFGSNFTIFISLNC